MLTTSAAGAVLDDVLVLEHAPAAALEATFPAAQTPALTSDIMVVSRSMAEVWLEQRHPNRPLRPHHIADLAQLMRRGSWHLNGEPLLFDQDGRLLDGQHRLSALVQTGVSLPFVVIRGVPLAVQATLGQGIRRSQGDILAMHGATSAKTMAATMSWLWKYQHDLMLAPKRSYLPQDTLTVLLGYPGLAASVSWGRSVQRFLPASLGGMLHYLMHERDAILAKHFFTRLRDGLELAASDPLHSLRERLIEARTRMPRPPQWVYALWCVRCWNSLRNGGGPPTLPWDPQTDGRFPQVQ